MAARLSILIKQHLFHFLLTTLFLLIILADQIIKTAALTMPNRYNFAVFSDFFEIKTFYNYNLSFLSFLYLPLIIYILAAALVFFIFYKYIYSPLKIKNEINFFLLELGTALITSGAISNLSDRVRFGFVVDYFFVKWPTETVFNLSDLAIISGGAIIIKEIIKSK